MSLHKNIAVACALASAVLMGVSSFSPAAAQKKKPAPAAGPSKAQVAAGQKVYAATGCAACHKIGDKGGATGPELTKAGKGMNAAKVKAVIRKGAKSKAGVAMPAYGTDKISDKDLTSLMAYLSSMK